MMDTVKVRKDELLAALKANREQHRGYFLKAQEGWQKRVTEELGRRFEDAKAGRKVKASFSFPEPEDHSKDYDRVIRMTEMSVDNVLELTGHEFANFVMDDWEWKRGWTASNTMYYAAATGSPLPDSN